MDTDKKLLADTVAAHILQQDEFSKWLGIKILRISEGESTIQMTVRPEMLSGLGIVHGGIAFSLADTAFALACNSRNTLSVALDTSINFLKPVNVGDVLTATAKELHNGKSTGLYSVTVTNQFGHVAAVFKGTCFRTGRKLV